MYGLENEKLISKLNACIFGNIKELTFQTDNTYGPTVFLRNIVFSLEEFNKYFNFHPEKEVVASIKNNVKVIVKDYINKKEEQNKELLNSTYNKLDMVN